MLKFVTKRDYWSIDPQLISILPVKFEWHLKSVQDAVAFEKLRNVRGKRVAEIGGGDSRILLPLSKFNTCYNIEEFKGQGGGPNHEIKISNVSNIPAVVGDFNGLISANFFDIIFSVSVVEHVPFDKIKSFFEECHEMLIPGGIMIHLIDVYLEDDPVNNKNTVKLISQYRSAFVEEHMNKRVFKPFSNEVIRNGDVRFSTSFATNPDNAMMKWNISAPGLKEKRTRAQSCTLIMMGTK